MSDFLKDETPVQSPKAPWRRRLLDDVAVLVILPSVLAGTARWWWIGDLCVHFRVPYVIATALLLVVYLRLRRWRWATALSVVLAVNIGLLWPLFEGRPSPTAIAKPLRVMVANVHIDNTQSQPLLDCVREEDPDVLVLIEVDDRWLSDVASLNSAYPYSTKIIRDEGWGNFGPFGMALFSKFPLSDTTTPRLGTAGTPAIVTTVTQGEPYGGQQWTVIAAHPYPPVSAICSQARNTLLRELAAIVAGMDGPRVLVGDLNITRWSPHFADLLDVSGLHDSEVGCGYQPTWPTVPVIPIDHVLVSPDVVVLRRHVGTSIASDHRPVIADVAVRAND